MRDAPLPAAARFAYRDGVLHAGQVPLPTIAEAAGTPVYVYLQAGLEARYQAYREALAPLGVDVCYAVKANDNQAVIRTFADLGAGMDVVSGGELARVQAAGVPGDRVVFSGVGKSAEEIVAALAAGVHQINIESREELARVDQVAGAAGLTAPVAIRVNPDVDPGTHAKITTGLAENKFGIDLAHAAEAYAAAGAAPHVRPVGLAVHIGSQLLDLAPYRTAYGKLAALVRTIRDAGHGVERLDLGGGLGVAYRPEQQPPALADYAGVVGETVGDLGCALMIEPGRSLTAGAGVLLTRCVLVKQGVSRRFVILDAAMNDLLRPSLYDAYHAIRPVDAPAADGAETPADIVGPVCESGDTFAKARPLPPIAPGDLLAIDHAGAYGAVMASRYNARPPAAEVMVHGDAFALVRKRPSLEEIIAADTMPPWMPAQA
jgi:diaminopimelate decarboxylase